MRGALSEKIVSEFSQLRFDFVNYSNIKQLVYTMKKKLSNKHKAILKKKAGVESPSSPKDATFSSAHRCLQ